MISQFGELLGQDRECRISFYRIEIFLRRNINETIRRDRSAQCRGRERDWARETLERGLAWNLAGRHRPDVVTAEGGEKGFCGRRGQALKRPAGKPIGNSAGWALSAPKWWLWAVRTEGVPGGEGQGPSVSLVTWDGGAQRREETSSPLILTDPSWSGFTVRTVWSLNCSFTTLSNLGSCPPRKSRDRSQFTEVETSRIQLVCRWNYFRNTFTNDWRWTQTWRALSNSGTCLAWHF